MRGAPPGSAPMHYLRTHARQGSAYRQGRRQGFRQKTRLQNPVDGQAADQLHVEFIPRVAKVLIIWKNAYARIALSQSMVPTTHS